MQTIIINITWEWALGIIGTLILIAYKSGGRFTAIESALWWMADRLKDLKIDIDNVRSQAFKNESPVILTNKGRIWLVDSGLQKYIDSNYNSLIESFFLKKETNAYEIQEHIFALFDKINFPTKIHESLRQYAYEQGISIDVLYRIGAIYLRDMCLNEFKLEFDDADNTQRE